MIRGLESLQRQHGNRSRKQDLTGQVFRAETPVLVCEACLRASCFHGHAECARVFESGVVTRTVAELDALRLEHPSHYAAQLSRARIARAEEIAAA